MALTTLAHHIDIDWLREAYRRTRKDGATGVDGQTAEEYAKQPGGKPPVAARTAQVRHVPGAAGAAVHIPKGDGSQTRPIGIPTFEDKVLQRAVAMVLEAVYEQDFLDCSYGFRPGRSAHQALEALRDGDGDGGRMGPGDGHPEVFRHAGPWSACGASLRKRVRDGVMLRLIGKWLNAGVLEDGSVTYPESRHAAGRGAFRLCLRTSTCTKCWTSGSSARSRHGSSAVRILIRYADDAVFIFERSRMRGGCWTCCRSDSASTA